MLKIFVLQDSFMEVFIYTEHRERFLRATDPWLAEGGTQQQIMWCESNLRIFLSI